MNHRIFLKEILIVLLLAVSFILLGGWYRNDFFIAGYDFGYPIDNVGQFKNNSLWVWMDQSNFGNDQSVVLGFFVFQLFDVLLSFMNPHYALVEKFSFSLWSVLIVASGYVFSYYFFQNHRYRFLRIWVALFILFNFFIVTRFAVFEKSGLSMMIAILLSIPLILQIINRSNSTTRNTSLLGLVFFFFNSGGIPPFVGIFFYLTILFFLLYLFFLKKRRDFRRGILIMALSLSIFLLVNAYWFLPSIYKNLERYREIVYTDNQRMEPWIINWLDETSRTTSILNVLKLQGQKEWHLSPAGHYSDFWTKTPIGIGISGIIPLIVFSSLLITTRWRHKILTLFFSLLALIAIFFASGSHPPFGKYFVWIFTHVPFFAIYRTPYYKFAYFIVIAYAFLFGYTIQWLIQRISASRLVQQITKKDVSNILGFLVLLPFFGMQYLYFSNNIFKVWDKFDLRIRLPDYVLDFQGFMKNRNPDERILLLPKMVPEYSGIDTYQWGYSSTLPLQRTLVSQPMVNDRDENWRIANKITEMYEAINAGNTDRIRYYANMFGIKYLLLRNDFAYNQWGATSDDPQGIKEILKRNEDHFLLVQQFGEWEFYEIREADIKMVDIIRIDEYSKTTFDVKKINPTKYIVKVHDTSFPIILVLKNAFHRGWRIYEDKDAAKHPIYETWFQKPFAHASHVLSNEIFNGWQINPPKENFNLIIEYWPQKLFYLGSMITMISLIVCLGLLVWTFLKRNIQ